MYLLFPVSNIPAPLSNNKINHNGFVVSPVSGASVLPPSLITKLVAAEPSFHTISKVCFPTDNVFKYSDFSVIIVEPSFAI